MRRTTAAVSALLAAALLVAVSAVTATAQPRSDATGRRTVLLGRSLEGRPIRAFQLGDLDSPRTVLVVGCIHGDECSGIAIARQLATRAAPPETDLWVIPDLNPDGSAAGTRGNAHGVDLNRNFPWRWRPLQGVYDSGARPLSEPESRIAYRLVRRIRPTVSIWFHQHLDVVDDSSGSIRLERRFARVAHLPLRSLAREPGSAVTWQSHCYPTATSFVVELPAGRLDARAVARLSHAVAATAAAAPERRPQVRAGCRP